MQSVLSVDPSIWGVRLRKMSHADPHDDDEEPHELRDPAPVQLGCACPILAPSPGGGPRAVLPDSQRSALWLTGVDSTHDFELASFEERGLQKKKKKLECKLFGFE